MTNFELQLIILPVSDIDRTRKFYEEQAGFTVDHDQTVSDEIRFVQVTPPGSACSIAFGRGLTDLPPSATVNLQVVVDDVEQARAALAAGGVDVSPVDDQAWGRFVYFSDPDGHRWAVQEIPARP